MQTLAPVAAPEIVVLTTHGAASDDKARSMTTHPVTSCTPFGKQVSII